VSLLLISFTVPYSTPLMYITSVLNTKTAIPYSGGCCRFTVCKSFRLLTPNRLSFSLTHPEQVPISWSWGAGRNA
jgi:hypothetical protein